MGLAAAVDEIERLHTKIDRVRAAAEKIKNLSETRMLDDDYFKARDDCYEILSAALEEA
jgi:hypothetical protein